MTLNSKKISRPRILCFVSHYLPGYKSGGPVKSINNLVEHLSDDFEFLIITTDRDLKDKKPYPAIRINQWNKVGNAKVFYASKSFMNIISLLKFIKTTKHDIIYLNSFFNFRFTIIPLIIRKFFLSLDTPFILVPRGEFSAEALNIKFWKKKLYIVVASMINLFDKIVWQAASKSEYKDIFINLSIKKNLVKIAPDLSKKYKTSKKFNLKKNKKTPGNLKIIFLSRINPMKNLDFLIKVLDRTKKKISLNIYGPIEDKKYWNKCKNLINHMPSNIVVIYKGVALPNKINSIISNYHLLILPSRGESYGHVILESLTAGTPVMISNKTPWKKTKNSITVFPLKNTNKWIKEIEKWVDFDEDKLLKRRLSALKYAKQYLFKKESVIKNKNFFLHFIN